MKNQLLSLLIGIVLSSCTVRTPFPDHVPSIEPLSIDSSNVATPDEEWDKGCMNQEEAMRKGFEGDVNQSGVPCYQIDLTLQPETGTYTGKELVTFHNTSDTNLSEIIFRLYPNAPVIYGGLLEVEQVLVNGIPAMISKFLSDNTGLKILLSKPLKSRENVEIQLVFSGSLPEDLPSDRFLYGTFYQGDQNDLWVMANAFPILANLSGGDWSAREVLPAGDPVTSQTALFSVRVTSPIDWNIVTTGIKIEEVRTSEEQLRSSFISGPVRDFMIVAGSQLNFSSDSTTEGIQINHWSTSGAAEENSDIALKIARQALEIFQAEFGPYPYKELDIVAVPLDNALGVEYPGLILIQDGLYLTPDEYNTFAIVIAHEIAHQWWYNLVGNDVYQAPWLDEALATYSGYLYARKISPDFYTGVTQYQEGRVTAVESELGSQPFDRPIDFYLSNEKAYSAIVYQKGALFFDALRGEIGERDFTQAIKTYYSTNRYQMVVPDDLLDQFEDSCSCQLDGFYSDWGIQEIP